jgi:hypothetical protein
MRRVYLVQVRGSVSRRMPCRSHAGAARQLCLRVTVVNSSSKCDIAATSIPVRRVLRGSTVSMVAVAIRDTYGAHVHGVVGGVASTRSSKHSEAASQLSEPSRRFARLATAFGSLRYASRFVRGRDRSAATLCNRPVPPAVKKGSSPGRTRHELITCSLDPTARDSRGGVPT